MHLLKLMNQCGDIQGASNRENGEIPIKAVFVQVWKCTLTPLRSRVGDSDGGHQ